MNLPKEAHTRMGAGFFMVNEEWLCSNGIAASFVEGSAWMGLRKPSGGMERSISPPLFSL